MFVWLSVMNPHRLTWGFSYDFNFAAIVALTTIVSALMSKDLRRPPLTLPMMALVLFMIWIGVTTLFALHASESFEIWKGLMKTLVMSLLITMLFHRKDELRLLVGVIALSIAFYGVKGGIFVLTSGAGDRVWGPPGSYIEDNNAVAVALVMCIPLLRY